MESVSNNAPVHGSQPRKLYVPPVQPEPPQSPTVSTTKHSAVVEISEQARTKLRAEQH